MGAWRPRLDTLDRLAWDFDEYDTADSYARLHWYPATFVPQLPRALIDVLSREGDTVMDPFCGSGTVAVEAVALGRNAVASDINPIARTITAGRLALATRDPSLLAKAISVAAASIVAGIGGYSTDSPTSPCPEMILSSERLAELAIWYHPDTLSELLALKWYVDRVPSTDVRRVLLAVVSALAKPLSSQTKSWGHIADNVRPKELTYKSVPASFRRSIKSLLKQLSVSQPPSVQSRSALLVAADARRQPLSSGSVDLVVTSFPYPEMSDYILANRLSLLLFEHDPIELLRGEIGARRKRFQRDSLPRYQGELADAIMETGRVLRRRGHLALVGPEYDSQDPRAVSMDALEKGMSSLGLELVKRIERFVPARRKRQSWGTLEKERIVIWRKR